MITPTTIKECNSMSCTDCVYKEATVHGYGIRHICKNGNSDQFEKFPIYSYNRCSKKRQFIMRRNNDRIYRN